MIGSSLVYGLSAVALGAIMLRWPDWVVHLAWLRDCRLSAECQTMKTIGFKLTHYLFGSFRNLKTTKYHWWVLHVLPSSYVEKMERPGILAYP
jgi:hypothetical protein